MSNSKTILIVFDQIAFSTGGFWSVIDIIQALDKSNKILIKLSGFNFFSNIIKVKKIFSKSENINVFVDIDIEHTNNSSIFFSFISIFKTIYIFFIKLVFSEDKTLIEQHEKKTDIVFLSSFLSIKDLLIYKSRFVNARFIQNHAGMIETMISRFPEKNEPGLSSKDMYANYIEEIDRLLFQSESIKNVFNDLFSNFSSKSTIIMPVVDEKKLKDYITDASPFNTKKFNIVYVATIQERKRQDFCVEIFSELCKKFNNLDLYLIGSIEDMKYFKKIENQIKLYNLKNKVIFSGYRTDFANFIFHSDIVIHTSSAEGVPRTLREAMYLGKAIVASDLPGNIDLLKKEDSGILVERNNKTNFVDELSNLIEDKSLIKVYEERARMSYYKTHRKDVYQKSVRQLFGEILKK